jgi:hypothetical protein
MSLILTDLRRCEAYHIPALSMRKDIRLFSHFVVGARDEITGPTLIALKSTNDPEFFFCQNLGICSTQYIHFCQYSAFVFFRWGMSHCLHTAAVWTGIRVWHLAHSPHFAYPWYVFCLTPWVRLEGNSRPWLSSFPDYNNPPIMSFNTCCIFACRVRRFWNGLYIRCK